MYVFQAKVQDEEQLYSAESPHDAKSATFLVMFQPSAVMFQLIVLSTQAENCGQNIFFVLANRAP